MLHPFLMGICIQSVEKLAADDLLAVKAGLWDAYAIAIRYHQTDVARVLVELVMALDVRHRLDEMLSPVEGSSVKGVPRNETG